MRQKTPQRVKLWDVLNPDVPQLLDIFEEYVDEQRATGISAKAIATAKKMQEEKARAWVRRVEAGGSPAGAAVSCCTGDSARLLPRGRTGQF